MLGGIAVGVVLSIVVLALVLVNPGGSDKPKPTTKKTDAVDVAATQLSRAATHLSNLPAAHYEGTLTGASGEQIHIDIKMTYKGSTYGTLTVDGAEIQLMAVDAKTFLKAGESYWVANGAPNSSLKKYAKRWVRVPISKLGFDLSAALAPTKLAQQVRAAVRDHQITAGPVTTVDGVQARQVTVPAGTVYVTAAAPQRIVRIEATSSGTSGGSGSGGSATPGAMGTGDELTFQPAVSPLRPASSGGFQLDLTGLTQEQAKKFINDLQSKVQDLKSSVDSQVNFTASGTGNLEPCNNYGCTANVRISNFVSSSNPYLGVKQRVTAEVTINFQLDGGPAGSCSRTISMAPNGSAGVSCNVSYYARTDQNHQVTAQAQAVARAVVSADIQKMATDLKEEIQDSPANCDLPTSFMPASFAGGTYGGGVTSAPYLSSRASVEAGPAVVVVRPPGDQERCGLKGLLKDQELPTRGKVRYVPPEGTSYNMAKAKGLPKGTLNGRTGFRDAHENVWVRGPARSQKSLSEGATYEWDVQLTKENQRRYRWLCERERKKNITHLNVTPGGEISHVVCE
ncbi:polymorphic toxin type 17 domain-containing protein [Actinomadura sp. K4S16]|uniref:polymorphic toxin type 17 domain-containing protein n=1 Tax=Actinomadura sp. K4S16 TaxID=1316147 RepID=UPI001358DDBC|nr:polymorphic toxin type 17 domain-containing protein [Actinomadura sp. K4S16]